MLNPDESIGLYVPTSIGIISKSCSVQEIWLLKSVNKKLHYFGCCPMRRHLEDGSGCRKSTYFYQAVSACAVKPLRCVFSEKIYFSFCQCFYKIFTLYSLYIICISTTVKTQPKVILRDHICMHVFRTEFPIVISSTYNT